MVVTAIILLIRISAYSGARDGSMPNKFGVGFHLGQYQKYFGLGIHLTRPYWIQNAFDNLPINFRSWPYKEGASIYRFLLLASA